MNLIFASQAWADYLYWQTTDPRILRRINELIRDASRSPLEGIGKPEALRHSLRGFWSRRISEEHRMVYRVTEQGLEIAQLRFQYD
jgi:toxin YoeB